MKERTFHIFGEEFVLLCAMTIESISWGTISPLLWNEN